MRCRIKKILLLALLLSVLSFLWVMPFCYYWNVGWCADFEPIILGIIVPPSWFGVGLVFLLAAWFLDKYSYKKAALITRWAPFVFMAVSVGYFLAAESLRKCVISAASDGDTARLKKCLNLGGDVDSLESRRGSSALWLAVANRHVAVIDVLLSHDASVRNESPCSTYAPLEALKQKSPTTADDEIRQKLLKAGAMECR